MQGIALKIFKFRIKFSEMRQSVKFRIYGLIEALVVVCVVLLFRSLDRKTASQIATGLFIAVPLVFLLVETRLGLSIKKALFFLAHLQFLVFFAFPILYLNFIVTPTEAMSAPTILGLTMQQFHQFSNYSYFFAAFSCFASSFLFSRQGD